MILKKYRGVHYGERMARAVHVVFKQASTGPDMTYVLRDCLTFEWGFKSNSCKDLAYAILANQFNDRLANILCQDFAEKVIKLLPDSNWELTSEEIIQRYEVEITLDALRKIK